MTGLRIPRIAHGFDGGQGTFWCIGLTVLGAGDASSGKHSGTDGFVVTGVNYRCWVNGGYTGGIERLGRIVGS